MSHQTLDPFFFNDEKYDFLRAENIYSLFDPEKYGLVPEEPITSCMKGFLITFSVKENTLFWDNLEVYCENGVYPPINGVQAKGDQDSLFMCYDGINMKMDYSGTIIIGKNMIEKFWGRAFTGPHCYETTFELTFENGQLVECRETSGEYDGY